MYERTRRTKSAALSAFPGIHEAGSGKPPAADAVSMVASRIAESSCWSAYTSTSRAPSSAGTSVGPSLGRGTESES